MAEDALPVRQGWLNMSTKETVQRYFDVLKQKGGWDSFLAEDLKFTSFSSPVKEVTGRSAYLESTKRFFSMVDSLEVRELIVEGAKACALTRYQLRAPGGTRFQSDVAEIFTVRDGKIAGFAIYFDTAPFPK
jgi:ketosteroid isomerase-like protein